MNQNSDSGKKVIAPLRSTTGEQRSAISVLLAKAKKPADTKGDEFSAHRKQHITWIVLPYSAAVRAPPVPKRRSM